MSKTENYLSFKDIVLSLKSQRFTRKLSPYCGKIYWIVKCKEHEFKVLENFLEDKDFLKLVEDNSIIGKNYTFSITVRGSYLIKATEIL